TDPACADAPWLRPMTEIDVYRHMYALGMVYSQGSVADGIVSARPGANETGRGSQHRQQRHRLRRCGDRERAGSLAGQPASAVACAGSAVVAVTSDDP